MPILRLMASLLVIGMNLDSGTSHGQDFPSKAIRVVTSEPGGGSDLVARLVAQGIAGPLGQPVIVDNRPVRLTGEVVARSAADGYSLLFAAGNFWIGPLLQKTTYDPVKDFLPISMISKAPNILVVHPSLPVKSVRDLIALAKSKPGQLNYAGSGIGGATQLSGELFKAMAGVNIVYIPYSGAGPAINALLGGQVQLMFATAGSIVQHIKSGRLRAVAVTSAESFAQLPSLPTIAASGIPGYESDNRTGMFAPANTSVTIINRLNQEIVRYLKTADAKEKFSNSGVETVGSSPAEFSAMINAEIARLGKVIKDAGLRAD